MSEADQKAQAQAKRMKAWFKEREVPKEMQIGSYLNFINTARYIQTAIDTLDHSEVNSTHYRAAYFRLFRLKKELENNK